MPLVNARADNAVWNAKPAFRTVVVVVVNAVWMNGADATGDDTMLTTCGPVPDTEATAYRPLFAAKSPVKSVIAKIWFATSAVAPVSLISTCVAVTKRYTEAGVAETAATCTVNPPACLVWVELPRPRSIKGS